MEGLLGFLLVAVPLFLVARRFYKKAATQEAFAALPEDGPMKVNISEESIPAGSFGSKRFTCALKVEVKISQSDWRKIANMGLMDHIIITGHGFNDGEEIHYKVSDLQRFNDISTQKSGILFNNTIQMREAKTQLIEGLHNLKAQLETHHTGPKRESFEI